MWDDEKIATLRRMWFVEGKSGGQIAAVLGMTRNAVIGKATRLPRQDGEVRAPRARQTRRPPAAVQARQARELEAVKDPAPTTGSATCKDVSGCRWPFGDGPFTFCDRKQFGAGPYCAGHSDKAFQKVKP